MQPLPVFVVKYYKHKTPDAVNSRNKVKFLIKREIFQKFLINTVDTSNYLVVLLHRRFTFKGVLTAKQPKGCDAKLQGLLRRQAEWQPVATLRRSAPCWWINFYEKEIETYARCVIRPSCSQILIPGIPMEATQKIKRK